MREGPRYDWIIAVSNSAESGIKLLKTYCKVSEIKQILVDLAKRDARKDAAAFKHGTDDIDQLPGHSRFPARPYTSCRNHTNRFP